MGVFREREGGMVQTVPRRDEARAVPSKQSYSNRLGRVEILKTYKTYTGGDEVRRVRAMSPIHAAEKISSRLDLEEGAIIEVNNLRGVRQGYRVGNLSRVVYPTGRV